MPSQVYRYISNIHDLLTNSLQVTISQACNIFKVKYILADFQGGFLCWIQKIILIFSNQIKFLRCMLLHELYRTVFINIFSCWIKQIMLNLGWEISRKLTLCQSKLKNTQKKLFMDEWSFQKLPPVLGSHCIPFQAPAVVSKKVYIPLALVVLFHNAHLGESAHPTLHSNLHCSLGK